MNYTYIVECADGTFYTGWTSDIEHRIKVHNGGKGAKYTRSRLPVALKYAEIWDTKQQAMSREWGIKKMSRKEKMKLMAELDEGSMIVDCRKG